MKHRLIISLLSLGIISAIVGGVYWEWPGTPLGNHTGPPSQTATATVRQLLSTVRPPRAEAQEGVAAASPIVIGVTEPTDVTVTIQITDSRLIANSVSLQ